MVRAASGAREVAVSVIIRAFRSLALNLAVSVAKVLPETAVVAFPFIGVDAVTVIEGAELDVAVLIAEAVSYTGPWAAFRALVRLAGRQVAVHLIIPALGNLAFLVAVPIAH